MKKVTIAAAVLAASTASAVSADNHLPSYSYAQAGYSVVDSDMFYDDDGDGFAGMASLEVSNNIFVFGGYSETEFGDFLESEVLGVGVGYFAPIGERTTWHSSVGYARMDVEFDDDDFFINEQEDYDCFGWEGGIRTLITDTVELNGGITGMYEEDLGTQIGMYTGALWNITPEFGFNVQVAFSEDGSGLHAGVRYTF